MSDIKCGNPHHPNGAFHNIAPYPYSWHFIERFKQWRNYKRWGCSCYATPINSKKELEPKTDGQIQRQAFDAAKLDTKP